MAKYQVTYTTPPDRGKSYPDQLPHETMEVEGSPLSIAKKLDGFTKGGEHEVLDIKEIK